MSCSIPFKKFLASLAMLVLTLPAFASPGIGVHPRILAVHNTVPSAHEHGVHAHIHTARPHHTR